MTSYQVIENKNKNDKKTLILPNDNILSNYRKLK